MLRLYFDKPGETRFIGEFETVKETMCCIQQFLAERNFKSYYTIVNDCGDNSVQLDVGSWTEFFIIEGVSFEDFRKESDCNDVSKTVKVSEPKYCHNCFYFNDENGDEIQFCDYKEIYVHEDGYCCGFKAKLAD